MFPGTDSNKNERITQIDDYTYDLRRYTPKLSELGKEISFFVTDIVPCEIPYDDKNDHELRIEKEQMTINLHGVDSKGATVCVKCYGFHPFFYVLVKDTTTIEDVELIECLINEKLESLNQPKLFNIKLVKKNDFLSYQEKPLSLMKIYTRVPNQTELIRSEIENIFGPSEKTILYESNIGIVKRFITETKIHCGSWVKVSTNRIIPIIKKVTNAHIEIDTYYKEIMVNNDKIDIAPLRILLIKPMIDELGLIRTMGCFLYDETNGISQRTGNSDEDKNSSFLYKAIFTTDKFILNSDDSNEDNQLFDNLEVFQSEDERLMLKNFNSFLQHTDPDIILGFDLYHDLSIISERAKTLRSPLDFSRYLLPITTSLSLLNPGNPNLKLNEENEDQFSNGRFNSPGRLKFDLLTKIKSNVKLSSFSICSVTQEYLMKNTPTLSPEEIGSLQEKIVAQHCIVFLQHLTELMENTNAIIDSIEMARACGVTFSVAVSQGMIAKVYPQIYRKCAENDFVITEYAKQNSANYDGGHVFSPLIGFYEGPVLTLDFQSLYPSIMIANNICYSTYIMPNQHEKDVDKKAAIYISDSQSDMEKSSQTKTLASFPEHITAPNDVSFVCKHIRKGILPQILEELLDSRRNAQLLYKEEISKINDLTNSLKDVVSPESERKVKQSILYHKNRAKVFDCRQKALKIVANSVYGFTGHPNALYNTDISESVTSIGKDCLFHANIFLNQHKTSYGSPFNIIYGDTDSLFINFPGISIEESIKIANKMAEDITNQFHDPIKFRLETIYKPFAIFSKKKYVGVKYIFDGSQETHVFDIKGLESIRRDSCLLVQDTLYRSLEKWFKEHNEESVFNIIKESASIIADGTVDPFLLILSKQVGKEGYKTKQAHYEAALRQLQRNGKKGETPKVGERIPYIIISGKKSDPLYTRSEDPSYVISTNQEFDKSYYLEKQLIPPLERTFSVCCGESMRERIKSLKDINFSSSTKIFTSKSKEEKSKLKSQLDGICKKCRGFNTEQDIECCSYDCPFVYKRMKL